MADVDSLFRFGLHFQLLSGLRCMIQCWKELPSVQCSSLNSHAATRKIPKNTLTFHSPQNPTPQRPRILPPPRRPPRHRRNQHRHPHGGRRVVHIVRIDGVDGGEVEGDDGEEEVQDADEVEGQAEAAERVAGVDVDGGGEAGVDACEEGEDVA